MEIAEEEEEEQRAAKRQSIAPEEKKPSAPEIILDSNLASSPKGTQFSSSDEPPTFVGAYQPFTTTNRPRSERRLSSQSARTDIYAGYYSRPKVKLAPRPSMDIRPRTAGNYRPTSALPPGFKIFSRRGQSKNRNELDETIQEDTKDITFNATTVPIPEAPPTLGTPELMRPHTSCGGGTCRPLTSSGISVKSLKLPSAASLSAKENKMTPEKARLIKAMQLRERKKRIATMAAVEATSSAGVLPVKEGPAAEADGEHGTEVVSQEAAEARTDTSVLNTVCSNRHSIAKADSGVALGLASPSATDLVSEDTQTESHATSPVADPSDVGSTKASSLSDSTDETINARTGGIEEVTPKADVDKEDVNAQHGEGPENKHEGILDDICQNQVACLVPERTSIPQENTSHEAVGPSIFEEKENRESQESNMAMLTMPVSPVQDAPVSKSSPEIEASEAHSSTPGAELSVSELTMAGNKSPRSSTRKISVSRFSSQDAFTTSSPPMPSQNSFSCEPAAPKKNDNVSPAELHGSSILDKQKLSIDPIRTDVDSTEKSEGHLSEDDDDLMEELQSATLEEATHMTVSKSPITPVFPTPAKSRHGTSPSPVISRTASNPAPLRGPLSMPSKVNQGSARSVSTGAAFLHKMAQQQTTQPQTQQQSLAPKVGRIGSSISQRIKALEKISASNGSSESVHLPSRHHAPSSAFFSVRKNSSTQDTPRPPFVVDRGSMLSSSPADSREDSPEAPRASPARDRAGPLASRLSMFEAPRCNPHQHQPVSAPPARGRTDSIQVTAKIVRDSPNPCREVSQPSKDHSELPPFELKQSLLVVDMQNSQVDTEGLSVPPAPDVLPINEGPKETITERRQSQDKRRSMSADRGNEHSFTKTSSLSIMKDFIKERRNSTTKSWHRENLAALAHSTRSRSPSRPPSTHQNTFSSRRLSIGSRHSSISRENSAEIISPSAITEISASGDEKDKRSKKRASRFIRRLSASLSGSRKNMAPSVSPTLREEEASEVSATDDTGSRGSSTQQQQAITAFMGEVNVQFPDTLLWKRRNMCLDSHGFLIISTAHGHAAEKHLSAGVKRYHMSDFRTPYIPDVEIQELPNSVILDFIDGSGLQVACEDRSGQLNVLHILQDAHQNHKSFGH